MVTEAAFELALSWAPHSVLSPLASSMPCILLLGLECSLLLLSSSFRPQPSALSLQDVVPEAESVAPQQQLSQPRSSPQRAFAHSSPITGSSTRGGECSESFCGMDERSPYSLMPASARSLTVVS